MRIKSGVKYTYICDGLLDVYPDAEGEVDMVVSYSPKTEKLEYIEVDPIAGEYKVMFTKEKKDVNLVGINGNVLVGTGTKLITIDELGKNETVATDDTSIVDVCCGLLVRFDGFIAMRGFDNIIYLNRPLDKHKIIYTHPLPIICVVKMNKDIQESMDLILNFHTGAIEFATYHLQDKSVSGTFVFDMTMTKKHVLVFDNLRSVFLCKENVRDDIQGEIPYTRMGENVIAIDNKHLLNLDIDKDYSASVLVDKFILHIERFVYIHKHKDYSRKLKIVKLKDYVINEDKIEMFMHDGRIVTATPDNMEMSRDVAEGFNCTTISKAMLN